MSWDSVPWFVGGGAEHSPEVARLLSYAATRGAEGIIGVADLKVSQLAVAGAGFQVAPGACVIYNRSAGAALESYIGRMAAAETKMGVSPTGAGAGRSDLVIARITDPQYAPWMPPADRRVGPYIETFIVEGVPAGTTTAKQLNLGYPAIALARIDLPASTAAVTNAMIVDLRKVANPRNSRDVEIGLPGSVRSTGATNTWVQAAPFGAVFDVPEYATTAEVTMTVSGLLVATAAVLGELRANFLGSVSQATVVDENHSGSDERCTYVVGGRFAVPANMRGSMQSAALDFRRTGGTGALKTDTSSTIVADIHFSERAE